MKGNLILLVEDNRKVQNFNKRMLADEGYAVETAMTLAGARAFIEKKRPNAIILDIGMPDGNGLDFLRELRRTSNIPVLLLTGYGEACDIVVGFKAGCDDYLPKPYTFEVLLMRLERLLKSAAQLPESITKGSLTLKLTPQEAFVGGENLNLSPLEYRLLQYFAQNEGRLMTTENIYETVWGRPMAKDSNAIRIMVSRLRKKLTGCGYTLSNEYENGYCFESGEP